MLRGEEAATSFILETSSPVHKTSFQAVWSQEGSLSQFSSFRYWSVSVLVRFGVGPFQFTAVSGMGPCIVAQFFRRLGLSL